MLSSALEDLNSCSNSQKATLPQYIEACEVLGLDMAVACTRNPSFAKKLIYMVQTSADHEVRLKRRNELLEQLPDGRLDVMAAPFLRELNLTHDTKAMLRYFIRGKNNVTIRDVVNEFHKSIENEAAIIELLEKSLFDLEQMAKDFLTGLPTCRSELEKLVEPDELWNRHTKSARRRYEIRTAFAEYCSQQQMVHKIKAVTNTVDFITESAVFDLFGRYAPEMMLLLKMRNYDILQERKLGLKYDPNLCGFFCGANPGKDMSRFYRVMENSNIQCMDEREMNAFLTRLCRDVFSDKGMSCCIRRYLSHSNGYWYNDKEKYHTRLVKDTIATHFLNRLNINTEFQDLSNILTQKYACYELSDKRLREIIDDICIEYMPNSYRLQETVNIEMIEDDILAKLFLCKAYRVSVTSFYKYFEPQLLRVDIQTPFFFEKVIEKISCKSFQVIDGYIVEKNADMTTISERKTLQRKTLTYCEGRKSIQVWCANSDIPDINFYPVANLHATEQEICQLGEIIENIIADHSTCEAALIFSTLKTHMSEFLARNSLWHNWNISKLVQTLFGVSCTL